MIQYGCLSRYFNLYKNETIFAKENKFSFLQLWYDNSGLVLHKDDMPFLETIKKNSFPSIIHALLDINDFESCIPNLVKTIMDLNHKEVIIHPICERKKISEPNEKLNKLIKEYVKFFKGIKIYLENNAKIDSFFNKEEEIKYIFDENPDIEFLLDIAHTDSYEQLNNLIKIKYPKILHVSDKRSGIDHEHLPIGKGDINFEIIFNRLFKKFEGKIIFEIQKEDKDIINSRRKIESIIKTST